MKKKIILILFIFTSILINAEIKKKADYIIEKNIIKTGEKNYIIKIKILMDINSSMNGENYPEILINSEKNENCKIEPLEYSLKGIEKGKTAEVKFDIIKKRVDKEKLNFNLKAIICNKNSCYKVDEKIVFEME